MSPTSRTVSFAVLGGFLGALVMAVVASMMLVPTPMGGQLFFVAAAMQMGVGSMSTAAGWTLHLFTGVIVGAIFGVVVSKVSKLRLNTPGRALTIGIAAGTVVWVVFFIPLMAMMMPALMGMGSMVAGSLVAHILFGLVLGGVTYVAVSKGASYKCPTCGASFSSQDELMQHGKAHMSSTPQQEYKCPACGATFASRQELTDHGAKAHPM